MKVAESPSGKANVIHCNKNKFGKNGMTHLAVVLVDCISYDIQEAWLITKKQAKTLRKKDIKSKIIYVDTLRQYLHKIDITSELQAIADKIL